MKDPCEADESCFVRTHWEAIPPAGAALADAAPRQSGATPLLDIPRADRDHER
jgi:hypothetical protein